MKQLISFGERHGKPKGEDLPIGDRFAVIDIRPMFGRNPYHDKKLRKLRGTDKEVQEDILKTPDFARKYDDLKAMVGELLRKDTTVYIGCTGGHHRSVYLVERLGTEFGVPIFHRDFDKK